MIRVLEDIIHCDRVNTKRTDSMCIHCVYCAKLAGLWLCMWGQFDDEEGDAE